MLSINQFCHDCMSHFIIALVLTKYMAGCPIAMLTPLQVPVLWWWQSWDPVGVHSAFQVLGGRALQQAPIPCELQRRFRERTPKGPLSQFNYSFRVWFVLQPHPWFWFNSANVQARSLSGGTLDRGVPRLMLALSTFKLIDWWMMQS